MPSVACSAIRIRRFVVWVFCAVAFLVVSLDAAAQSYLTQVGNPTFATPLAVEMGYYDASTGDLHLEVPLGSWPQRGGHTFSASLVYDSRIWTINNHTWSETNIPNSYAGWRLQTTPALGGRTSYSHLVANCPNGDPGQRYTYNQNFTWTDPYGTVRSFPIYTQQDTTVCNGGDIPSDQEYANDSSGYLMSVTNFTTISAVYAPDGSQVYPGFKDSNGNYFSSDANGNIIDTLGRTLVKVTTNCNGNSDQICYDVLNSQFNGSTGTSRYTVTTEAISVSTAFGQSGVTEWSGAITVWQSIQLPDGTAYQFTYDNGGSGTYGEVTGVTLPTQGSISYTYTTYADMFGNRNRWLYTRTSGGGQWTYSPLKLSTCPTGYSYCQQVTAFRPSGDQAQFNFASNAGSNGSWGTSATYYNSPGPPHSVLSVSTTWTSTSLHVQKASVTTQRLDASSPYPTSTIQYTYGTTVNMDVTAIKEWKYYTGSLPSTPDRVTNMTYFGLSYILTNKPTMIYATNGGSTPVAQTVFCYDKNSSCSGAESLTTVSGTFNHDDTNFGASNTSRGNVTSIEQCTSFSGSSCVGYLITTMTHDTTGQTISVTDPKSNLTTLSYTDNFAWDNGGYPPSGYSPSTPTNAYLTKATAGSLVTQYDYYYGSGNLACAEDPNSAISCNHFNDSAHPKGLTLTNLPATYVPSLNGYYNGGVALSYSGQTQADTYLAITSTPSVGCSGCRHDQTTLDNLGRQQYQYLVNDPDGETTSAVSYDTNGRPQTTTYPYRSSASATDTFAYDGLDRVTKVTHADGSVVTTYFGSGISGGNGNGTQLCSSSTYGIGYPTLVVDEAGKKREVWTDGFRRTIEVDEPDSSGSLTKNTCYSYDLNNNILQVVSATSQTRSYQYDALSRVTSVGTPEMNVGGTQRYTTFTYPVYGSVCSGDQGAICTRTDPKGITTTYTFDSHNRLTQIQYSDGTTPTVTYCYDNNNSACGTSFSSAVGLGRRTAMKDGSGDTAWSYDAVGRIVTEQRTIAGVTKTIGYGYDLDGSLAQVTYPSGNIVNYAIGNAERALSATDSAGSPQYAASASYAPNGTVSSIIYGKASGFNGTTESRSYNNRLEITSIGASSSNGTAMNLGYCFNTFTLSSGACTSSTTNNSSVNGITNGVDTGEAQAFSYDNLNRMLSAATKATSGNDCWGQSFSGGIDAVANLTGVSVTQCSAGSLSVSTDGENHLSYTGFSYDNAGNMTADGSYTYAFDAENRMKQASGMAGGPYCYIYDGDALRAEKGNGGTCPTASQIDVLYWRSTSGDVLAETDGAGNTLNEYVFFGGRRIAQRTSSAVFYYYSDLLGTVHTVTNATGQSCYDADFTPYGQEVDNPNVSQTCAPNYRFAGYEVDSETGLYYAMARHYSWRLGRFMSTDPVGGDTTNPQSLNGYAYVWNMPCSLIDPSGLAPCSFNIAIYGGGLLSNSQMKALQNAFRQVFSTASVGVNFNFSGNADYSVSVVPSETPLTYNLSGGAVTAPAEAGGATTLEQNHGFAFFDVGVFYGLSDSSTTLGAVLGRIGAHEAGHYLLQFGHNPPVVSGLGGIMDARVNALDPNLWFTPGQGILLDNRCKQLRSGAASGAGGGGGGGASGGADGDPTANPFGAVDQGGGGYATYVCSTLVGAGSAGCAWNYHAVY